MGNLPFEDIKRKIIVKREVGTDSKFSCEPEKRSVKELIKYGVINLNKPSGPTSHQIVDYVKKILEIGKAGHSGTLDPKVTGVLPIALDRATRIVQVLLPAGKEYVCLMHLHKEIKEEEIKKAFEKFSGEIKQLPPVRSAVKRQERKRNVYYVEIMEVDGKDVLFRIGCQAGTYIRKWVSDLGKHLNCGAHMSQLIRTKAGPFSDKKMYTLHDLKDVYEFWKEGSLLENKGKPLSTNGKEEEIRKIILPFEQAVDHLGKIWVVDGAVDALCHGADLYFPGIVKFNDNIEKDDIVAIFTLKNELICIGEARVNNEDFLKEGKGVAVKTTKVFMERGIYRL